MNDSVTKTLGVAFVICLVCSLVVSFAAVSLRDIQKENATNNQSIKILQAAKIYDKSIDVKYYKHKGVYAFRKQALLDFTKFPMQMLEASEKIECIRYLEFGKKIKMVETHIEGVEIDTPEDLERAKNLWKND